MLLNTLLARRSHHLRDAQEIGAVVFFATAMTGTLIVAGTTFTTAATGLHVALWLITAVVGAMVLGCAGLLLVAAALNGDHRSLIANEPSMVDEELLDDVRSPFTVEAAIQPEARVPQVEVPATLAQHPALNHMAAQWEQRVVGALCWLATQPHWHNATFTASSSLDNEPHIRLDYSAADPTWATWTVTSGALVLANDERGALLGAVQYAITLHLGANGAASLVELHGATEIVGAPANLDLLLVRAARIGPTQKYWVAN